MDVDRWIALLADIRTGKVELVARDTREPSPFSHEILNANPYAFLDDAPLEERRARAVTLRRGLSFESASDLGRLDPEAIAQVRAEAWPEVRDAEELHDTLNCMCLLRDDEAPEWKPHFDELVETGRALTVDVAARVDSAHLAVAAPKFWTVAERWPLVKTLYPDAVAEPEIKLPESVRQNWESPEAIVTLVRGRMQTSGPTTAEMLGEKLSLEPSRVFAALEAIEAEGTVMRGRFTQSDSGLAASSTTGGGTPIEWCERRLWRGFIAARWTVCVGKFSRSSRAISFVSSCAGIMSRPAHNGTAAQACEEPLRSCRALNWPLRCGNGAFCRCGAMNMRDAGWMSLQCRGNWFGADCVRRKKMPTTDRAGQV